MDSDSQLQLNEDTIIAWLREHPLFFSEHPELMTLLELPSEHLADSGSTSLVHFQARRLKSEVGKLQGQLKQLAEVAKTNEQLMHKLHAMNLDLLTAPSLAAFIKNLVDRLTQDFGADAVCLHLQDPPGSLRDLPEVWPVTSDELDWLEQKEQSERAQCGRFTQAKLKVLFPNDTGAIKSAAVVAIAHYGWLAIGAHDQAKFQPQMGTLFLTVLATTVEHRLSMQDSGRDLDGS